MSHGTLIGGTGYEIAGGTSCVGGTAYSIGKGKTLRGGTGYDINFVEPVEITYTEASGSQHFYNRHKYTLTDYWNGNTLFYREVTQSVDSWDENTGSFSVRFPALLRASIRGSFSASGGSNTTSYAAYACITLSNRTSYPIQYGRNSALGTELPTKGSYTLKNENTEGSTSTATSASLFFYVQEFSAVTFKCAVAKYNWNPTFTITLY